MLSMTKFTASKTSTWLDKSRRYRGLCMDVTDASVRVDHAMRGMNYGIDN